MKSREKIEKFINERQPTKGGDPVQWDKVAIADVLLHKKYGLVSNQPRPGATLQDFIRTRDIFGNERWICASDCIWPTGEQFDQYWRELDENLKKQGGV